jgi:hypothetical protein
MTRSPLLFTGRAYLSPRVAADRLQISDLDTHALEADLINIPDLTATALDARLAHSVEAGIVDYLTALRAGRTRQAKSIAREQLAPSISQVPDAVWKSVMQRTYEPDEPLAASAAVYVPLNQVALERPDIHTVIKQWQERVAALTRHSDFNNSHEENCVWLTTEWVGYVESAQSLEELCALLSAIKTTPFPFFANFWREVNYLSPLRRAVLKFWRPGVILPWHHDFVDMNKLFILDDHQHHALDEDDIKWLTENVGDINKIGYAAQDKARAIVEETYRPRYERMLAAMALFKPSGYGYGHRAPYSHSISYFEERATSGRLDVVDLYCISRYSYYGSAEQDLTNYSEPAQIAIYDAAVALTNWNDDHIVRNNPFPLLFDSQILKKLSTPVATRLVTVVTTKGLQTGEPLSNTIVDEKLAKRIPPAELKRLIELYEADREQTLVHASIYKRLVEALPEDQREPHYLYMLSLLDAEFLPGYSLSMDIILNCLRSAQDLRRFSYAGIPDESLAVLVPAVARASVAASDACKVSSENEIWSVFQGLLRVLYSMPYHFLTDRPDDTELIADCIEACLAGPMINLPRILAVFEATASYLKPERRDHITVTLFGFFTSTDPGAKVYRSMTARGATMAKLIVHVPPARATKLLDAIEKAYYSNPFSGNPASVQKDILTACGINLPETETKEGLGKLIRHTGLSAAAQEKVIALTFMEAHPLNLDQRKIVVAAVSRAHHYAEDRSFLENVCRATKLSGMVFEWVLLLRDLQALSHETRLAFMADQEGRSVNPARMRRTLKNWLREKFISKIRLSSGEAARFKAHYSAHRRAWTKNNFIGHLENMVWFSNDVGKKAIKTLVMGIVSSSIAEGADLGYEFRYRWMTKRFGKSFVAKWSMRRVYRVADLKGYVEPPSPAEAKATFARQTATQVLGHLKPYTNKALVRYVHKMTLNELDLNFSMAGDGDNQDEDRDNAWQELAEILAPIYDNLLVGTLPEEAAVTEAIRFFEFYKEMITAHHYISLREIENDLRELRRGMGKSFTATADDHVIITGDPRDILRAGLIGRKSCTRPTESSAGNGRGQPAGRAVHGPLLMAIYMRGDQEAARTLIEASSHESAAHYTAWPLYAEGGFMQSAMLEQALLADARHLEIDGDNTHIQFTGKNMEGAPELLAARYPTYPEGFSRPNEPAQVSVSF